MTGSATPRPAGSNISGDLVSFPFFGPWGRWYPWYTAGFGGGLGFVTFNPWGYGATCWGWGRYGSWYDPYSYCWNPSFSDSYYYSDPGGSSGSRAAKPRETTGSVRLKVNPASAKVYIDGALVGTVDEFNGLTDHLEIDGGHRDLELRADGYQTYKGEIVVAVGKTQTVRVSMKKSK